MNRVSKEGLVFIRKHEGFRLKAYRDPVGIPTIGVGFTMRSESFRQWWARWKREPFTLQSTMTAEEIDDALGFLIAREYGKAVDDFLQGKKVPQNVFDAAVSAVFNLGPGALKWRWAKAMKGGDYRRAAAYLRVTGTTAKGKTLPGLVRRRSEEADLLVRHHVKPQPAPTPGPMPPPDYVPPKPNPVPTPKRSGLEVLWDLIARLFTRRKP